MVKTMVSCKFSLKPIQWSVIMDHPQSPTFLVTPLIQLRSPGFDVHWRWDPQWQPARLRNAASIEIVKNPSQTMESPVVDYQCPHGKKCQTCQTKSIVIWSWEKICHHGDLIPITPIFNSFIPYYIDHGFWKGFDIRGQILSTLSPINRDNSERFRKLHSNGPANAISEI